MSKKVLPIALAASLALAAPVFAADPVVDTSEKRSPIVWLLQDIGNLLQGDLEEREASHPASEPETEPSQSDPTPALVEATEGAPKTFENPFAAIFKDLAKLFRDVPQQESAATTQIEETTDSSEPEPDRTAKAIDPLPPSETTEISDTKKDPITWIISDIADLFGQPASNVTNAEQSTAGVEADVVDTPTSVIEVKTPVQIETASPSDQTAPAAANAEQDQKRSGLPGVFDWLAENFEPANPNDLSVSADDVVVPEATTAPRPIEMASSALSKPSIANEAQEIDATGDAFELEAGPWLVAEPQALFDPDAIARRDGPMTEAVVLDIPIEQEVRAAPTVDVVVEDQQDLTPRIREETDFTERNYRSVGQDNAALSNDSKEPGFLENFVAAFFGERSGDTDVTTIEARSTATSEQLSSKVPTRIIPEEQLELGYNAPDLGVPAAQKDRLGENLLTDIDLFMGANTVIGRRYEKDLFGANDCLDRPTHGSVFCLAPLVWPADVANSFEQDTAYTRSSEAILRFENGALSRVYSMFRAADFADVVRFMQKRFGPPIEREIVWMHMIEAPKLPNTTFRWKALSEDRRDVIVLEVRNYDDLRRSFANTDLGMVRLYREGSRPIFKHLTTMDMMLIQRRRVAHAPVEVDAPPPQN